MLKYLIIAVSGIIIFCLLLAGFHNLRVYLKNKKEMKSYSGLPTEIKKEFGKVLIVYYSLSGNTRDLAEKIQQQTNADLYEIKTKEELPSGVSLYSSIKKQVKSGNYPELQGEFPDFESYDLIFVGAPVWWYTVATPVLSFLEKADFKNKYVVPFSTQGSNPGTFFEDFEAKAKNAIILPGKQFNNISKKYDNAIVQKVIVWLNSLDVK